MKYCYFKSTFAFLLTLALSLSFACFSLSAEDASNSKFFSYCLDLNFEGSVELVDERKIEQIRIQAMSGDFAAKLKLSEILIRGSWKNRMEAIKLLQDASNQNIEGASIRLARAYEEIGNFKDANDLYEKLAEDGSTYAQLKTISTRMNKVERNAPIDVQSSEWLRSGTVFAPIKSSQNLSVYTSPTLRDAKLLFLCQMEIERKAEATDIVLVYAVCSQLGKHPTVFQEICPFLKDINFDLALFEKPHLDQFLGKVLTQLNAEQKNEAERIVDDNLLGKPFPKTTKTGTIQPENLQALQLIWKSLVPNNK